MPRQQLNTYASGLWWLFALMSFVLVVFGLVTLFYPGMTLAGLVTAFAVFVVIYGLVELFEGFHAMGKRENWWFSLVVGVLLLGLGVYLVKNPDLTISAFAGIVGLTLLLRGIVDVVIGLFYNDDTYRLHWYISGALGVVAGIVIWTYPVFSSLEFAWVLGLWALVVGVASLAKALAVKALTD